MANVASLYELFGVSNTCTDDELRKSFLQLISKVYPDRNHDQNTEATRKTQELNAAYQALKNHRTKPQPAFSKGNNDLNFSVKFSFLFNTDVDLNDVANRKTSFRQKWEMFRDNPSDPICALLLIHASTAAQRI